MTLSLDGYPVVFDRALRQCDRESALDVVRGLFDSQRASAFRIDPNTPRIGRGDGAPAVFVGDHIVGKRLLHREIVDYRLMPMKGLAPDLLEFGLGLGGKQRPQYRAE